MTAHDFGIRQVEPESSKEGPASRSLMRSKRETPFTDETKTDLQRERGDGVHFLAHVVGWSALALLVSRHMATDNTMGHVQARSSMI